MKIAILGTGIVGRTLGSALVDAGHEVHLFICGDDEEAEARTRTLLGEWFGWRPEQLFDLGGIRSTRGTEACVVFRVTVMQAFGTPCFSVELRQGN